MSNEEIKYKQVNWTQCKICGDVFAIDDMTERMEEMKKHDKDCF